MAAADLEIVRTLLEGYSRKVYLDFHCFPVVSACVDILVGIILIMKSMNFKCAECINCPVALDTAI